jgi:hypothetical protein
MITTINEFRKYLNENSDANHTILHLLPKELNTKEDVVGMILILTERGLMYHFDDSAHELVGDTFTTEEANMLNALMEIAHDKFNVWEDIVTDVFLDYTAITADGRKLYVIKEGGPDVRLATSEDMDRLRSEENTYRHEEGEFLPGKVDEWFEALPKYSSNTNESRRRTPKEEYKFDKDGNVIAVKHLFDKRKWAKLPHKHRFGVDGQDFFYDEERKGWFAEDGTQLHRRHLFLESRKTANKPNDKNEWISKVIDVVASKLEVARSEAERLVGECDDSWKDNFEKGVDQYATGKQLYTKIK